MYAVAINGSPRADGNTAILLGKALAPLAEAGWETETVHVGGKPVRGCTGCFQCFENQDLKCVIRDFVTDTILEKMLRADAVIIGSPTYFADVTAETKALLDRTGFVAIANNHAFAGKIGAAAIAVRRAGAVHAFDTINHFFLINQMIVPGSVYWNLGIGMDAGEVAGDEEGMANMDNLGKTIAWLGKAIAPYRDSFPREYDESENS